MADNSTTSQEFTFDRKAVEPVLDRFDVLLSISKEDLGFGEAYTPDLGMRIFDQLEKDYIGSLESSDDAGTEASFREFADSLALESQSGGGVRYTSDQIFEALVRSGETLETMDILYGSGFDFVSSVVGMQIAAVPAESPAPTQTVEPVVAMRSEPVVDVPPEVRECVQNVAKALAVLVPQVNAGEDGLNIPVPSQNVIESGLVDQSFVDSSQKALAVLAENLGIEYTQGYTEEFSEELKGKLPIAIGALEGQLLLTFNGDKKTALEERIAFLKNDAPGLIADMDYLRDAQLENGSPALAIVEFRDVAVTSQTSVMADSVVTPPVTPPVQPNASETKTETPEAKVAAERLKNINASVEAVEGVLNMLGEAKDLPIAQHAAKFGINLDDFIKPINLTDKDDNGQLIFDETSQDTAAKMLMLLKSMAGDKDANGVYNQSARENLYVNILANPDASFQFIRDKFKITGTYSAEEAKQLMQGIPEYEEPTSGTDVEKAAHKLAFDREMEKTIFARLEGQDEELAALGNVNLLFNSLDTLSRERILDPEGEAKKQTQKNMMVQMLAQGLESVGMLDMVRGVLQKASWIVDLFGLFGIDLSPLLGEPPRDLENKEELVASLADNFENAYNKVVEENPDVKDFSQLMELTKESMDKNLDGFVPRHIMRALMGKEDAAAMRGAVNDAMAQAMATGNIADAKAAFTGSLQTFTNGFEVAQTYRSTDQQMEDLGAAVNAMAEAAGVTRPRTSIDAAAAFAPVKNDMAEVFEKIYEEHGGDLDAIKVRLLEDFASSPERPGLEGVLPEEFVRDVTFSALDVTESHDEIAHKKDAFATSFVESLVVYLDGEEVNLNGNAYKLEGGMTEEHFRSMVSAFSGVSVVEEDAVPENAIPTGNENEKVGVDVNTSTRVYDQDVRFVHDRDKPIVEFFAHDGAALGLDKDVVSGLNDNLQTYGSDKEIRGFTRDFTSALEELYMRAHIHQMAQEKGLENVTMDDVLAVDDNVKPDNYYNSAHLIDAYIDSREGVDADRLSAYREALESLGTDYKSAKNPPEVRENTVLDHSLEWNQVNLVGLLVAMRKEADLPVDDLVKEPPVVVAPKPEPEPEKKPCGQSCLNEFNARASDGPPSGFPQAVKDLKAINLGDDARTESELSNALRSMFIGEDSQMQMEKVNPEFVKDNVIDNGWHPLRAYALANMENKVNQYMLVDFEEMGLKRPEGFDYDAVLLYHDKDFGVQCFAINYEKDELQRPSQHSLEITPDQLLAEKLHNFRDRNGELSMTDLNEFAKITGQFGPDDLSKVTNKKDEFDQGKIEKFLDDHPRRLDLFVAEFDRKESQTYIQQGGQQAPTHIAGFGSKAFHMMQRDEDSGRVYTNGAFAVVFGDDIQRGDGLKYENSMMYDASPLLNFERLLGQTRKARVGDQESNLWQANATGLSGEFGEQSQEFASIDQTIIKNIAEINNVMDSVPDDYIHGAGQPIFSGIRSTA